MADAVAGAAAASAHASLLASIIPSIHHQIVTLETFRRDFGLSDDHCERLRSRGCFATRVHAVSGHVLVMRRQYEALKARLVPAPEGTDPTTDGDAVVIHSGEQSAIFLMIDPGAAPCSSS